MLRLASRRSLARSLVGTRSFASTAPRRAEIELEIDGKTVRIEQGSALIQACEKAGAHIPRYCYHEKLQIAGNCRMYVPTQIVLSLSTEDDSPHPIENVY